MTILLGYMYVACHRVIVEHARGARDRDSYRGGRDSYRRDYDGRSRGRNFSSSSSK